MSLSGFSLWQDTCCGPIRVSLGETFPLYVVAGIDTSFHEYTWQRLGGTYLFYFDGAYMGSDESDLRPTGFFFGHPQFITCGTWTTEQIDFIEVTSVGPTTTERTTMSALKSRYR